MNESVSNLKTIGSKNRWTSRFESGSRRVGHGGTAWASKSGLVQPQDGVTELRDCTSRITDISKRLQLAALGGPALTEPEDARLTGGTRSLVRRLLGLNIMPQKFSAVSAKAARPAKKVSSVAAKVSSAESNVRVA